MIHNWELNIFDATYLYNYLQDAELNYSMYLSQNERDTFIILKDPKSHVFSAL